MEKLEQDLNILIDKIDDANDFKQNLDRIVFVSPFNKYEYITSSLLAKNILSFEEYLELRDDYIKRNRFLPVFEITAPRSFGDTWVLKHLQSVAPELKRPKKKIDPSYTGQYDLYLPYSSGIIRIEVKASRAVDKDKSKVPLYVKALFSDSNKRFLMNFQQLKPSCCDVFLWLAVYKDCVKYWVLKNTVIQAHHDFTSQHRNKSTPARAKDYEKSEIYEGQIMITNTNINSIENYLVESRAICQAIIEQFEA